eukprot:1158889-Pelagomonas_calceolata.AAC.2
MPGYETVKELQRKEMNTAACRDFSPPDTHTHTCPHLRSIPTAQLHLLLCFLSHVLTLSARSISWTSTRKAQQFYIPCALLSSKSCGPGSTPSPSVPGGSPNKYAARKTTLYSVCHKSSASGVLRPHPLCQVVPSTSMQARKTTLHSLCSLCHKLSASGVLCPQLLCQIHLKDKHAARTAVSFFLR